MEIKVYEDRQGRSMTERQKSTVWNALYVAAQAFEDDASKMRKHEAEARKQGTPGVASNYARLAEQFELQAIESRDLIETFE